MSKDAGRDELLDFCGGAWTTTGAGASVRPTRLDQLQVKVT